MTEALVDVSPFRRPSLCWNEVESNADPRAFRVEQNRAVKEVRGEQDQEPLLWLYVCKTGGSSLGGKLRSGSPIANTHLTPTRDQAFHLRERGSNGSVSNSIVDSGTSSLALPKNLLHAMFAEFSEAQQALLKSAVLTVNEGARRRQPARPPLQRYGRAKKLFATVRYGSSSPVSSEP